MKRLELNTDDESLREVFGNGRKYAIPRFQRDYSWEHEHWNELWQDVAALVAGDMKYHYMGYLVIKSPPSGDSSVRAKVIDGQQRLTTFSLLILAAIKRLKELGGEDARVEYLMKNYIGSQDAKYLVMENKLVLNRNNDYYYKKAVEGETLPPREMKTVRFMQEAIDYFHKQFKAMTSGEEIGGFIDRISENLLFTTIYIGDELSAYKVFETLNARGVQLSSGDLLKNFIFSIIDSDNKAPDKVLDRYDAQWQKIGGNIGDSNYAQYILNEWNSRHKLVRKTDLFSNIKKSVRSVDSCKAYLNDLERKSGVYAALHNHESEFWKDDPNHVEIKRHLRLLRMFNIAQPISVLMAVHDKRREDFLKVLEWIKILSMRYNVICRKFSNEQEALYSQIAVMIHGETVDLSDIKAKILELYPSDEEFAQAFADKTFPTERSNKRARYVLARLAEEAGNAAGIDEQMFTVEHILPLNPDEHWVDYFGDGWDTAKFRLGNMAIVTTAENKQLEQLPFEEKQAILRETACEINHNVCQYPQWNSESIASRQHSMARHAVKLWSIR